MHFHGGLDKAALFLLRVKWLGDYFYCDIFISHSVALTIMLGVETEYVLVGYLKVTIEVNLWIKLKLFSAYLMNLNEGNFFFQ